MQAAIVARWHWRSRRQRRSLLPRLLGRRRACNEHPRRQAQGKAEQSNPADLRDHVPSFASSAAPARWKRLADLFAHAPRGRRWSPYGNRRIFCYMAALARGDAERLLRFVAEAESIGGDELFTPGPARRARAARPRGRRELQRARSRASAETLLVGRRDDGGHYVELDDETRWRGVVGGASAGCLRCGEGHRRRPLSDFLNQRAAPDVGLRQLPRTFPRRVRARGVGISLAALAHEDVSLRSQRGRGLHERDRLLLDLLQPHLARIWLAARIGCWSRRWPSSTALTSTTLAE